MRSPDVFADDGDSDDSFDNFIATPIRRRSAAIVKEEEVASNWDIFRGL